MELPLVSQATRMVPAYPYGYEAGRVEDNSQNK